MKCYLLLLLAVLVLFVWLLLYLAPMAAGSGGTILPPPAVAHFGRWSVSAEITERPNCSSQMVGCLVRLPPPPRRYYLTVWFFVREVRLGGGLSVSGRRILKLPLP